MLHGKYIPSRLIKMVSFSPTGMFGDGYHGAKVGLSDFWFVLSFSFAFKYILK